MKYEPGLSPLQGVGAEGLFIFRELALVFILLKQAHVYTMVHLQKQRIFFQGIGEIISEYFLGIKVAQTPSSSTVILFGHFTALYGSSW